MSGAQEKSSLYWTTMLETLRSQMDDAIKDANVDAVESVLRLQRAVCQSKSSPQSYRLDWGRKLIQAVKTGHTEVVRTIMRTNPNVNHIDEDGRRALHYAAEIGSGDIVKQILNAGSPVNVADSHGATALYIAAEMGHSTATLVLLSEGANVNRPRVRKTGESPLHVACRKGRVEIVKFMLARGGLVNSETSDGQTPLHLAARAKQLEVARVLCILGDSINHSDQKGKTPLFHAAEVGSPDMAQLLIENGADVSHVDKRDRTPLHYLAAANPPTAAQEKVVGVLLQHMSPANLDLQDSEGCTVLHLASAVGNLKITRLLLAAGAGLNVVDSGGETPLNSAIGNKRVEIAKLLVTTGADVNIPDNGQAYPLHNVHSIRGEEKVSLVELLVKHGAKLNVLTARGYTPLDRCVFHYVMGNYNKQILKILVRAGARLKPLTSQPGRPQHNSPLCWLTWHNHISSGQFLVNAGWDLRHESWLGLPGKTQAAETFINSLRDQIQQAPSLWNECRRTIREELLLRSDDSDIQDHIDRLPLPPAVRRQLLFQTETALFDAEEST